MRLWTRTLDWCQRITNRLTAWLNRPCVGTDTTAEKVSTDRRFENAARHILDLQSRVAACEADLRALRPGLGDEYLARCQECGEVYYACRGDLLVCDRCAELESRKSRRPRKSTRSMLKVSALTNNNH